MTRRACVLLTVLLAAALSAAASAQDVAVELVRMGMGNMVRPGDPTGILLRLTSHLTEPVQTRVQWELRNADGDVALYTRTVALAPGSPTERWIYGVLPITSAYAASALDAVTVVRVLQEVDGRVTRELAVKRISGVTAMDPTVAVNLNEAMIGMLGDGRAGLAALSPPPGLGFHDVVPSMNESTRIARGIEARHLPDRWDGMASYDTLVWSNAPPQNLGAEQARALLDWVRRGGHLVILLPETGDPWGLLAGGGGRTLLAEVLPRGGITRHEGVAVRDLMPLISRTPELRNPAARTAVWTFDPQGTGLHYQPIMAMPCTVDMRTGNLTPEEGTLQGAVVAVRRTLAFGAITLVGIDADGLDRRALNPDGLPQTDIFWNRLIGRRADAPSPREWGQMEKDKRLESTGSLAQVDLDGGALINEQIGMRGAAAIGILGLVVAFGIYWVLAGPGIYYVLRLSRRTQYAWLAFVLVAGVATVVAWGATSLSEFRSGRIRHLTYLDRVVSPHATAEERSAVRARSWFSAQLPGYGSTHVGLRRGGVGQAAAGPDGLWTWFAPPDGRSEGFPDTKRYLVPEANPAAYDVPSRATTTVFSAVWSGAPSGEWANLPNVVGSNPLRQELTWDGHTRVPLVMLQGTLIHGLPAALTNVQLIHVNPVRPAARTMAAGDPLRIVPSAALPSFGRLQVITSWEPNTPLDVGQMLYGRAGGMLQPVGGQDPDLARELHEYYLAPVLQQRRMLGQSALPAPTRLSLLNYYNMLPQPDYLSRPQSAAAPVADPFLYAPTSARFTRDLGRMVDLSLWFTQPCLIVIGTLADEDPSNIPPPFPLELNGYTPQAEGQTIVRVIFPLPNAPGTLTPPLPGQPDHPRQDPAPSDAP